MNTATGCDAMPFATTCNRLMSQHVDRFGEILLIEDNAAAAERQRTAGMGSEDASVSITVRVDRLNGENKLVVARTVSMMIDETSRRWC